MMDPSNYGCIMTKKQLSRGTERKHWLKSWILPCLDEGVEDKTPAHWYGGAQIPASNRCVPLMRATKNVLLLWNANEAYYYKTGAASWRGSCIIATFWESLGSWSLMKIMNIFWACFCRGMCFGWDEDRLQVSSVLWNWLGCLRGNQTTSACENCSTILFEIIYQPF